MQRKCMAHINVLIFVESRYKVNRKRIKETVKNALKDYQVASDVEISIAIVGDRKMRKLNKKYRNLDKTTNVLSFSTSEGGTSVMPQDKLRLGDIVVSFPQVIREAADEGMLVDDKIAELVEYGLMHLLGLHHM